MSQLCHQSGERNRETSCKQDGFKSMFASFRIALLPTDQPSHSEYDSKRSKVYVGRKTIWKLQYVEKPSEYRGERGIHRDDEEEEEQNYGTTHNYYQQQLRLSTGHPR